MGFQSKRQQCCLLVLDAASSALLSEVSLVTHWVSLQRVGAGVRVRVGWAILGWKRLDHAFMSLFSFQ